MKEKCKKYEALFTFANDETLLKHVQECPDCKEEHEKMKKVSELLKEAKPLLRKRKQQNKRMKIACVLVAAIVGGVSFNEIDQSYDVIGSLRYGNSISIEDMGFPVDSYGLLMVD